MNALLISPKDNVAVVTENVSKGDKVQFVQEGTGVSIEAQQDIPIYHKIAIRDIVQNGQIIKYGYVIGVAITSIKTGEHVHCHNVESAVDENVQ